MMKRILFIGAAYVDTLLYLPTYPLEDSKVRADQLEYRRGGNTPNSAVVLSQLLNGQCCLLSALGSVEDAQFFINDLQRYQVDTSVCVYRSGLSMPSSYIIVGKESGTRTIVSYNQVPELTLDELCHAYLQLLERYGVDALDWVHIEGRNTETIQSFIQWLRGRPHVPRISLECEKPKRPGLIELLPLMDVVFFSRLFAESIQVSLEEGETVASAFLKQIQRQCRPG
jgi:ketohexokinase